MSESTNEKVKRFVDKKGRSKDDDVFMLPKSFDSGNSLIQTITKTTNEIYINMDSDVEEPSKYREIHDCLRRASENDKIILVVNTMGGYTMTATQIINGLLETKAKTKAEIHEASSAGSLFALYCDEVECKTFGYMMIHEVSAGIGGKVSDIDSYSAFMKKWDSELISKAYKDFLTSKEIEEVLKGKEFWFRKEDIDKRLKKWTPVRKRR